MRTRTRAAGVCAALIVALTGGAVATAGPAHADPATDAARSELVGICGSAIGAGVNLAQLAERLATRAVGYGTSVVAAYCLLNDIGDYNRAYLRTPEGQAAVARLRAEYGHLTTDDVMRQAGCAQVPVRVIPDDISTYDRTRWECAGSNYGD